VTLLIVDDVVAPAFGTDRCTAKGTILNTGDDLVGTMAVIEGTHDLEVRIPADRAGILVNDKMTRVTLVASFCHGDIL